MKEETRSGMRCRGQDYAHRRTEWVCLNVALYIFDIFEDSPSIDRASLVDKQLLVWFHRALSDVSTSRVYRMCCKWGSH